MIQLANGLHVELREENGKVTSFNFRPPNGGKAFVGTGLRNTFAKAIARVNGPPVGDPASWYETQLRKSKQFRDAFGKSKGAKQAKLVPGTRMFDV